MAKGGIDKYQRGVFCRYKYGDDTYSGTIIEVYADGCTAVKAQSGNVLYEMPGNRVVPAIPGGVEALKPDVDCRAVVAQGVKEQAKIVHVMADDTVAVIPKLERNRPIFFPF